MKLRRQQLDVSRNCSCLTEIVKFSCFVGNSDSLHSNEPESTKEKSLAPTNSSKGIQVANGVEANKETIEIVPSRTDEVKNVRN